MLAPMNRENPAAGGPATPLAVLGALLAMAAVAGGCVDFDYAGAVCGDLLVSDAGQCPRGYECLAGRCARLDAAGDGGAASDGGRPPDAGGSDGGTSVDGGSPSGPRLAFVAPASQRVTAGDCSGPIVIERQDAQGRALSGDAGLAVRVSVTPPLLGATVSLHRDGSCEAVLLPGDLLLMGRGDARTSFSFRTTAAGPMTISASVEPPDSTASASQTWNVTPDRPANLAVVTPVPGAAVANVTVRRCEPNVTRIVFQDDYGNQSGLGEAHTFRFPAASGSSLELYGANDTSCTTPLNELEVTAPQGATELGLRLRALAEGRSQMIIEDNTSGGPVRLGSVTFEVDAARGSLAVRPLGATGTGPIPVEAGGCLPLEIVRRDRFGSVVADGWSDTELVRVTLDAGMSAGLLLHGGGDCGTASSDSQPVSFSSYGQPALVFVSGHSAPPDAGPVIVQTTSATLDPGALAVVPLPLVRRGVLVFDVNQDVASQDLGNPPLPSGDISRTFLVFQAIASGAVPGDVSVECHLEGSGGPAAVRCSRFTSSVPAIVYWQTASWGRSAQDGGVSVWHGANPYSMANWSTDVTPPALPASSSFLLLSTATASRSFEFGRALAAGFLNPSGVLTMRACEGASAGCEQDVTNQTRASVQVVTMAGSRVDRDFVNDSSNPPVASMAFQVVSPMSVDPTRTALLHSAGFKDSTSTSDIRGRRWRGSIPSSPDGGLTSNALQFNRCVDSTAASCAGANPLELAWERIEFPPGTRVLQQTYVLDGGATRTEGALGPAGVQLTYAPHRTIFLLSGQGPSGQAAGETSVVGLALSLGTAAVDLWNSGTTGACTASSSACNGVRLERAPVDGGISGTSRFTVMAVEFKPWPGP